MKKTLILAALGLAVGSAVSNGQGYINFSSYLANGAVGATASYFSGGTGLIGAPFTAELYYSFGTVSDTVANNSAASITSAVTGLTLLSGLSATYDNSGAATGAAGLGYFDSGVNAVIPGYTSGPITFEVVAFNGADYASSTIRGRSGSWTESSIVNSSLVTAGYFGDNGTMPNMFVAVPVPEPGTLALAGIGGIGMLMALRRKKA
jgi:hypothetical protein